MISCTKVLRKRVRYAGDPSNPQLICLWLKVEARKASKLSPEKQWQVYVKEVRLLIDTLSDELIPAHWRACCLNHIYQPLAYLHRLAENERDIRYLNKLMYEVRVTSCFLIQQMLLDKSTKLRKGTYVYRNESFQGKKRPHR